MELFTVTGYYTSALKSSSGKCPSLSCLRYAYKAYFDICTVASM